MEIKGIKYIGPIFDGSGYASACRGNIKALYEAGVPLTLSPISFEHIRPDLGEEGRFLKSLENAKIDYNIVIMHSTPEFWKKFREPTKVNVGYTIWETSKLHPDWSKYINSNAEKVLVGCTWNVDVFKNSGVTVPIGVVPHGIDPEKYNNITPYNIAGVNEDAYVFYSIFQWTERKNPVALMHAYWYAFQNKENVALVFKTYKSSYSIQEKESIRKTLKEVKHLIVFDEDIRAKLYLIPDILSESEMSGLHARGDCYVSLDRGEGFGLNPFAAGACGNPIIVSNWGGSLEYAKKDNSYLINCLETPVSGMPWSPWYRGDQLWAEPNIKHAAELMKHVYENQKEAKQRGLLLKNNIAENFNWTKVGNKLIEELKSI